MDRIHKHVQVFLHFCNTTFIEDVESRALEEFEGLQKKLDIGEWLTSTPRWVDRPVPKEEGRLKSDGHGSVAKSSGGGGGRYAVLNAGVYLQLWIMEILGGMTAAARSENLCCHLAEKGRETCLRFHSNVDCIRSCTRSHVPLQGHSQ